MRQVAKRQGKVFWLEGDFVLAVAFMVLLTAGAVTRSVPLLCGYVLLSLSIILSKVDVFARFSTRERAAVFLLVSTLTVVLPISVLRSPTALVHYFVVLISIACAFVLTRNLAAYLRASCVALLAMQAALLVFVFSKGLANFPLETMFPHTSSNGITSCLVLLQANYSVLRFLLRRRASLITALLTLAVCVVGYGRGSILAAAGIVLINALSMLSWRSPGRAMASLFALGVPCGLLFALYGEQIFEFVQANTKIGAGLYDEARGRMIADYLGRIDAISLLLGADYRGTTIASDFYGNPHNAYIRAHHIFGLGYLLSVFAFPAILLWTRQALSVRIYAMLMLTLVLGRSLTEPLLFPTPFDFYFFAMCFALSAEDPCRLVSFAPSLPTRALRASSASGAN